LISITKILYFKTQDVPHTPQNDDETKGVTNLINSYTPHTKAIKLPRGLKTKLIKVYGGLLFEVWSLLCPKKIMHHKVFPFFNATTYVASHLRHPH